MTKKKAVNKTNFMCQACGKMHPAEREDERIHWVSKIPPDWFIVGQSSLDAELFILCSKPCIAKWATPQVCHLCGKPVELMEECMLCKKPLCQECTTSVGHKSGSYTSCSWVCRDREKCVPLPEHWHDVQYGHKQEETNQSVMVKNTDFAKYYT